MGVLSDIENNFSEITVNDLVRLGFKFRKAVVCWNSSEYIKLLSDDNLNDDDARNKILNSLHYWKKSVIRYNSSMFERLILRYHPLTSTRTAVFNNERISIAGCLCCHDMTGKLILCRKVNDIMDVEAALAEIKNV